MQDRTSKPQVSHGQTERRGMAVLEEVANKPRAKGGLGFLFRELPTSDYGLDVDLLRFRGLLETW